MTEPQDKTVPAGFGQKERAAKPAKPAPAPAPQDDSKDREQAEVGALRARVAQLEAERARERRTSDPRSEDYSAELALEEAWPGQVREAR